MSIIILEWMSIKSWQGLRKRLGMMMGTKVTYRKRDVSLLSDQIWLLFTYINNVLFSAMDSVKPLPA